VDVIVHSELQGEWLEHPDITSAGKKATIYLKLNSGMNRLGFKPAAYRAMHARMVAAGHEVNHCTHFANADAKDTRPNVVDQMAVFDETTAGLSGLVSVCNSAGARCPSLSISQHPLATNDVSMQLGGCTVTVFRQKYTLEDSIGSHACSLCRRATNVVPLGWPHSYQSTL
jgi:hypothetical protein